MLMRASETPQILACLRRLVVRPRQASSWSVVRAQRGSHRVLRE
ncbi:hypothetical protein NBRC111894_2878 [Sporolactobacillus inulinus]|uniref:Uncharacterized protein n=1 Tax=Sporolactobacillus inulinus TaxID=2078 RepID=A0A4Y1ZED8_9BACL|nr:hypothetical protein NBRC111894_2878 [Sporolactobacillus inulinus]